MVAQTAKDRERRAGGCEPERFPLQQFAKDRATLSKRASKAVLGVLGGANAIVYSVPTNACRARGPT